MSTQVGSAIKSVESSGHLPGKKPGFLYVFAILFIIGAVVVFIGTFAYFVSETNQYKKQCTNIKVKPSVFGIIMWVIGAIIIVAAIAFLIFFIVKGNTPTGKALSVVS